MDGATVKNNWK